MISTEIVRLYWRCRWHFRRNGDLHVVAPAKTIIIKEANFVPKSQRINQ